MLIILVKSYCGHSKNALSYPDEKISYPYSEKQLDDGLRLIQSMTSEVCQRELAQWLEDLDTRGQPDTKSVLLDGGWRTYPTSLRKEGFNITVLLEQDLATIKSSFAKEIARYTVPIPAKNYYSWDKYKFYPIAPTEIWSYSSEFGAKEHK